jgi:hypothetical protein
MFRSKALLVGIVLALALAYSPTGFPQPANAEEEAGVVAEIPADAPDDVLGYYTLDGGKTFVPIREEKGMAERIPPGTTRREFMEAHKMSPEAEAAIVQQVPPVPVIIDGVLYEPEQIHLFDGKQLGFAVGADGRLYAFTSYEAMEDFLAQQPTPDAPGWPDEYSVFYEGINRGGMMILGVKPGAGVPTLDYMDDEISSMDISVYATNGCTLFEDLNYQGNYFPANCGEYYPNLGWHGWNDRASSLIVWPR